MITLADAGPGDEDAIARLCTELDRFYGATSAGTPAERAAQVRAVLFTDPPMARALLAWDGTTLAGFAAYSFLWPAAGLTASLYLKELYVARAHRRGGTGKLIMERLYGIAVSKGCSRVEWTTDTGNTAARAFYDALGARPLPTKIFYRDAVAPESGRSPASRRQPVQRTALSRSETRAGLAPCHGRGTKLRR